MSPATQKPSSGYQVAETTSKAKSKPMDMPTNRKFVGGHEILPSGGHVAARWRVGARKCGRVR